MLRQGTSPTTTLYRLSFCNTNPSTIWFSDSCPKLRGEGGGGKSSILLVSLIGGGDDGGGEFWRKTSSQSSCDRPLSIGCCWSVELKRLDSEIRSEDKRVVGCETAGGDGAVLPLAFWGERDIDWEWDMGVAGTGEILLVFSAECPSFVSKVNAFSPHRSFSVSSHMLASLCLSVTRGSLHPSLLVPSPAPVCGTPGKMMASKLAWLSLSLTCQSVLPSSLVPHGEKGHGRPTEAAKVEVLLARCRSLVLLCRSLRGVEVLEEPVSMIKLNQINFFR